MHRVFGHLQRSDHRIGISEVRDDRFGVCDRSAIEGSDPLAFSFEFLRHGVANDAVRADN
jgi:hypothetical protein